MSLTRTTRVGDVNHVIRHDARKINAQVTAFGMISERLAKGSKGGKAAV